MNIWERETDKNAFFRNLFTIMVTRDKNDINETKKKGNGQTNERKVHPRFKSLYHSQVI